MKRTELNTVEVLNAEDLWSRFGTPLPSESSKSRITSRQTGPSRGLGSVIAALLTVLLHSLIFAPFLLGTAGHKYQPPLTEGAAASAQNSDASEFVSTLISISDNSITDPDSSDDSAYAVIQQTEQMIKQAASAAELASVSQPEISGSQDGKDDNAASQEATGDDAGRSLLFGRYMGQVKARIERVWEIPLEPFKGKFQCKVQIAQGERGEVKEVTLQRCNGTPAWQLSLVHAIQRASPLPAPPSEKVFTAVLTLNFEAHSPEKLANAAINTR